MTNRNKNTPGMPKLTDELTWLTRGMVRLQSVRIVREPATGWWYVYIEQCHDLNDISAGSTTTMWRWDEDDNIFVYCGEPSVYKHCYSQQF
jgi:hypothetical protein